jgi:hypothetical protein
MDKALFNGVLMIAHPEAPATAVCPLCCHLVDLRRREGTWFWRHQPGGPLTCPAHPNNNLVRETKDTHNLDDLRPDERREIIWWGETFQRSAGC